MVCERWRESYEAFLQDMGRRPSNKHSIDRVDVNGNYTPENCTWATVAWQRFNRRDFGREVGIAGIRIAKRNGKYVARIGFEGRQIHLGTFVTLDEAVEARRKAELKYYGVEKRNIACSAC